MADCSITSIRCYHYFLLWEVPGSSWAQRFSRAARPSRSRWDWPSHHRLWLYEKSPRLLRHELQTNHIRFIWYALTLTIPDRVSVCAAGRTQTTESLSSTEKRLLHFLKWKRMFNNDYDLMMFVLWRRWVGFCQGCISPSSHGTLRNCSNW